MRKCPADDFTLKTETYEGVQIDVCPHCNGVWLDDGELEKIQDTQDSDFRDLPTTALDSVNAAAGMAKAAREGARGCVVCDTAMEKREYAFTSQVMIDQCPKGHGMWLDRGELARLEKFYEDETDISDFLESLEIDDRRAGGFFTRLWGRLRS